MHERDRPRALDYLQTILLFLFSTIFSGCLANDKFHDQDVAKLLIAGSFGMAAVLSIVAAFVKDSERRVVAAVTVVAFLLVCLAALA